MSKEANLKIVEKINKNIAIKGVKMNTNSPIPDGQAPFDRYSFALLVCGQPASGKTSFIIDQLTRAKNKENPSGIFYKKFHKVYIFSPSTATIGKNLGLPDDQIIEEYDPQIIEEIINEQKEDYDLVERNNEMIKEYNKEAKEKDKIELEDHKQVLVIFDDFMSDIAKDKTRSFMRMLMNRRHLTVSIICMTQVFNRIPAKLRKGFSQVLLFKTKNRRELDTFRDELTSYNPKEFDELIDATLVNQHDFLVFNTYNDDIYRNLNPLEISVYNSDY